MYVDVSERISNGWGGITHQECLSLHGCFDASVPGTIFCFKGKTEGKVHSMQLQDLT